MSTSDADIDQPHTTATAKFELFHAPSFGDEDFDLATTSSSRSTTAVTSWTTSPAAAASTSSSLDTCLTVDVTGRHCSRSVAASSRCRPDSDVIEPPLCRQDGVVYRAMQYDDAAIDLPMIGVGEADYAAVRDRKYITSLYRTPPGGSVCTSPTLTLCHNNNNNVENNFRSYHHQFSTLPPTTMTLKHFDPAVEFPPFGLPGHHQHVHHQNHHIQQQQQQQSHRSSSFDASGLCRSSLRASADQQLQIATVRYDGTLVPASTGYRIDDATGCCRPLPGPLMNGLLPPRYEESRSPVAVKKSKSSKKRKKKDSNEPQKPVSAYALFFRDTQAAIKTHNPSASFGEMSKIVAAMWDSLDDLHKNIYRKRTEMAKKMYLKQLATYRASQLTKNADDDESSVVQSLSSSGSPVTSPDTTTTSPVNHAAAITAAVSVSAQQMSPLMHLTRHQSSAAGYSMTSSQQQQQLLQQRLAMPGNVTSQRYDVYGSAAMMTGNGTSHMLHQPTSSTAMNMHLYQHGSTAPPGVASSSVQPSIMAATDGTGNFVSSAATARDCVRWNYCSPQHDVTQTQKLDCQQLPTAWWIR